MFPVTVAIWLIDDKAPIKNWSKKGTDIGNSNDNNNCKNNNNTASGLGDNMKKKAATAKKMKMKIKTNKDFFYVEKSCAVLIIHLILNIYK